MKKTVYALVVTFTLVVFVGSSTADSRRFQRDGDGCVDVKVSVSPEVTEAGTVVQPIASVTNCGKTQDNVIVTLSLEYVADFSEGDFEIEIGKASFWIDGGKVVKNSMTFEIPLGIPSGTYTVIAKANSLHGGYDTYSSDLTIGDSKPTSPPVAAYIIPDHKK